MRILALDYGTRRIGVAVSDEGERLARPVAVVAVRSATPDLKVLDPILRDLAPGEIVVGAPRRLNGAPGTLAGPAAAFAKRVEQRYGVPVTMRDEGLTTVEGQVRLREGGASRKKRAALADAAAAAVLLQAYLDDR